MSNLLKDFNWKDYGVKHGLESDNKCIEHAIRASVVVVEKKNSVFDWKRYIKDHPDLQRTFGKDGHVHVNDATCHYLSHGIKECRKKYILGTNEPYVYDFDWKMYDKLNPDIFTQRNRGETIGKWHCFRHWCEYGYKEDRPTGYKQLVVKTGASISTDEEVNKRWRVQLNNVLESHRFNSIEELVNIVPTFTYFPLVVMPTYNRAANIDNLIKMMLNQTCPSWTFLIIDDGSTVENKTIFKSVQDKYKESNNIIFLENDTNKHIGFTLNRGIQYFLDNKSLTHLTWVSDDNIYYPNFLEKLYMSNKDLTYSWFDLLHITESDKVGNKKIHKPYFHGFEQLLNGYPGCAAFMWSRNAINKVGFYNENIPGCEDYEYMLRTIKYLPDDKRMQINVSLMQYVRHPESEFDKRFKEIKEIERKIVKIYKTLNVNNQTSAFIYYSKTKYDVLFQRPHQIMRFYDKSVIKCFIGLVDDVLYEEKYNLLVIPYNLRECAYNALLNHNITTYYTDSRLYNEVIQRPGKKLYDLIDAPIEEFTVWKPNLEKCVKNSEYVMYSHPDLLKFLNEIDASKIYHYISNACDYEHFSKAKERIGERPVDFPSTDKPILGYYGAFAQWLDFDIIRKYADEGVYHIVMIGGIVNSPSYNLRFDHPNITWLNHKPYKELPHYLSWFDKCFLPFKDCKLTTYVNPCKLWEYMASEKEIIKYNVNMTDDIVIKYEDVCNEIIDFLNIKLSVIILCFNKVGYTAKCIESVLKNTACKYEVVVVNNGSTDGTNDYLNKIKKNNSNVIIVNNNDNLGFSKGMNIGVNNSRGKYIILLNNDTIVDKEWNTNLIDLLENDNNIFATTPLTNFSGNESKINIEHSDHVDFFNKYNKIKGCLQKRFEVKSLALFCGAFRRSDFINIGYLDENYTNGWEDDDLFERISLLHKKIVVSTQSAVYHHGQTTVGADAYRGENKNRLYFEKKWNKKWSPIKTIENSIITNSIRNPKNIELIPKYSLPYSKNIVITGNTDGGSWFFMLHRLQNFCSVKNANDLNNIILTNESVIYLNSFLHSNITLNIVQQLKQRFNLKVVIFVHDYYWFCNTLYIKYNKEIHEIYKNRNRSPPHHINQLLDIVDQFYLPTKTFYNDIIFLIPPNHHQKFKVESDLWDNWCNEYVEKYNKPNTNIINNKINIGVLSVLDETKGLEQVNYLNANFVKFKNYEINYKIVGKNIPFYENNIHSFNKLIEDENINGILMLNKNGESWCYSLDKILLSQLPCLYNNFGSFKERIEPNKHLIVNNNAESDYYNYNLLKQRFTFFIERILELNKTHNVKVEKFCVYFPQFHNIKENNINFYDGFNDAINLNMLESETFPPLQNMTSYNKDYPNLKYLNINDLSEYNLLNDNIIDNQIKLLDKYNFTGIATYYYWFTNNSITNSKTIMFDVVSKLLEKKTTFFIWANENWTDNPAFTAEGGNIITNTSSDFDEQCIFLLKCFKHTNYYKIKNKPVFYLHHPWKLPVNDVKSFEEKLNTICMENGFDGVHFKINSMNESDKNRVKNEKLRYYDFHPDYKNNTSSMKLAKQNNCYAYLDYYDYLNTLRLFSNTQTIFFDFDNYARLVLPNKMKQRTKCINNTICNQIKYLQKLRHFYNNTVIDENDPFILLINSFNEWGEKMHIEPSAKRGNFYLELIYSYFS